MFANLVPSEDEIELLWESNREMIRGLLLQVSTDVFSGDGSILANARVRYHMYLRSRWRTPNLVLFAKGVSIGVCIKPNGTFYVILTRIWRRYYYEATADKPELIVDALKGVISEFLSE
jgi:hypothetical protein